MADAKTDGDRIRSLKFKVSREVKTLDNLRKQIQDHDLRESEMEKRAEEVIIRGNANADDEVPAAGVAVASAAEMSGGAVVSTASVFSSREERWANMNLQARQVVFERKAHREE